MIAAVPLRPLRPFCFYSIRNSVKRGEKKRGELPKTPDELVGSAS